MKFLARSIIVLVSFALLGAQSFVYANNGKSELRPKLQAKNQQFEKRRQNHWDFARANQRLPHVSGRIVFPSAQSLTSNTSIFVRGTIETGRQGVADLNVNGVPAVVDDIKGEWSAEVPLSPGKNKLLLSARQESSGRPIALDEVVVEQQRRIYASSSYSEIAVDASRDRVLIYVSGSNTIYAADRETGYRTVFTSNDLPNTGVPLNAAAHLIIDELNDIAFIANTTTRQILAIDLITGTRSVFANYTLSSGDKPDVRIAGMALDASNNRLLISDSRYNRLIALDQSTRNASVFVAPEERGHRFRPKRLVVDYLNNRALVASRFDVIESVDLTSGTRSLFTDEDIGGIAKPIQRPEHLKMDYRNNRLLVNDNHVLNRSVFAVDLDTGKQSVYVAAPKPPEPHYYYSLRDIDIDETNNELVGVGNEDVVRVDLETNLRSYLSAFRIPEDGRNIIGGRSKMVWSADKGSIYLADLRANAIYDLDIDTGERKILWDENSPNDSGLLFVLYPTGLLFDEIRNRILLATTRSITDFNLDDGILRLFSSESRPPVGGLYIFIKGIDMDGPRNRALAVGLDGMMAIDLDTGVRSIVSGPEIPDDINEFGDLSAVKVDQARGRALVVDDRLNTLFDVDLQTGARSIFSASGVPDFENDFDRPGEMVMDPIGNRVIIDDKGRQQLLVVDLITGKRSVLFDYAPEGEENPIGGVESMLLDKDNNLLYVLGLQYVYLIDMHSGDRVYLAH